MILLTYSTLHESDGCIKREGFARGRHNRRHRRISLLRRAPAPTGTWYRGRVDRQPDGPGTVSSHLHRPDIGIPRSDLSPTLPRTAAVYGRCHVPRPASAQAATTDLLAGLRAAARSVGGAVGRTVVLLKGKKRI